MPRAFAVAACSSLVAITMACSSTEPPSAPIAGSYTIEFPSLAAAVAVDTVQVFVFAETADASSACNALLETRRSGGALPATILPSDPVALCALDEGGGALSLEFGTYAVLIAAESSGTDVLLGCALQTLSAGAPDVDVHVTPASASVTVPATTCTSLLDHCNRKC